MKSLSLSIFVLLVCEICLAQQTTSCQYNKLSQVNPIILTAAENKRSDTADILKYTVSLDITDFTTKVIKGNTIVRFAPKINGLNYLCLDLLRMTIDSITYNNSILTYNYNDTLLKVNLPSALNTTDTLDLGVFYHGVPRQDTIGAGTPWGGWYAYSGYSFNLGVGFNAWPHCYGRIFHPCFDNFSERAKYDFNIITSNGKTSYCNGLLTKDTTVSGLRTRSWSLTQEIPSYLASIAVAAYTEVNYSFNGMLGTIPGIVAALPADTHNVSLSFLHLPEAFANHENHYGPYVWPRVGYCLVPFNGGAMEHATNISYGTVFANGTLSYESIMAHELSHHWWGDHTTCETAADMWLNEGIASYSEYLFREWVYGYSSYVANIKTNHEAQVHFVDLTEGLYALNSIPPNITYGNHVYLKGADMAHTMRGYMGDSLFKVGLKYVQQQKAFQTLNTTEFGQLLTASTGVDMNQFMNDWIKNPGWPHFSIDSTKSVSAGGGNFNVTVYVKQKLFRAPTYYTNVPMEITFKNNLWQNAVDTIYCSGQNSVATFTVPFDPTYAGINVASRISDAVSSQYKILKTLGANNFTPANLNLNVQTVGADSSWVRVEHSFVAPDTIKINPNNFRINTQHYWRVDGIFCSGFKAKGTFYYDGRKVTSGPTGYLDTCLFYTSADSILLLYRKNTSDDWKEVTKYTKTHVGAVTSKYGYFIVDTLMIGEYATANGVSSVTPGFKDLEKEKYFVKIFPNPAKNNFTIEIKKFDSSKKNYFQLYDISGKKMIEEKINASTTNISLNGIATGNYIVKVFSDKELIGNTKLIVGVE